MTAAIPAIVRDPDDPEDLGRLEVSGVRVARARFAPYTRLTPHAHEHACLTVVLHGAVEKAFAGATVPVASPGAVAMPAREPHRARFGRDGAEVVMLEPLLEPARMLGEATRLFDAIQPLADPLVHGLAWRLRREFVQPDSVTPLAVTGLALELLAVAARRSPAARARPAWLARAEEYLHAHFLERIELADLAAAIGQPSSRVARQFRDHLGVSPSAYVRRLRVEWAMRELADASRPLCDIGLDAGFADQSHFNRVFKRVVGVSPGRFRRELRA